MSDQPWCEGKACYASKAEAMKRIRHQQEDKSRRRKNEGGMRRHMVLQAYLCVECHSWHVGGNHKSNSTDQKGHPIKPKKVQNNFRKGLVRGRLSP